MILMLIIGNHVQAQFSGGVGRGDAMGWMGEPERGERNEIPTSVQLLQNYPNPFNPTTRIRFFLPESAHVYLSVYNIIGQELVILVDETRNKGWSEITFNASGLSSGVYILKFESESVVKSLPVTFIK